VEKAIAALSETNVKRHLREFCVSPDAATIRHEWGRRQLGFENQVSPAEMRRLFGWDFVGRVRRQMCILFQKTKAAANLKTSKATLKQFLKPEDAKIEKELERLAKWPAGNPGALLCRGVKSISKKPLALYANMTVFSGNSTKIFHVFSEIP
jgi:hypothetical protein